MWFLPNTSMAFLLAFIISMLIIDAIERGISESKTKDTETSASAIKEEQVKKSLSDLGYIGYLWVFYIISAIIGLLIIKTPFLPVIIGGIVMPLWILDVWAEKPSEKDRVLFYLNLYLYFVMAFMISSGCKSNILDFFNGLALLILSSGILMFIGFLRSKMTHK